MEAGLTLRAPWAAAGLNPGLSGRPHAARLAGQCGTASASGDAWNGHAHHVLVRGGGAGGQRGGGNVVLRQ